MFLRLKRKYHTNHRHGTEDQHKALEIIWQNIQDHFSENEKAKAASLAERSSQDMVSGQSHRRRIEQEEKRRIHDFLEQKAGSGDKGAASETQVERGNHHATSSEGRRRPIDWSDRRRYVREL
jgi:hypothetical protein